MDKRNTEKYCLSKYIVFRVLDEYLYINDMKTHAIILANADSVHILNALKYEIGYGELVQKLIPIYGQGIEDYLYDFLVELEAKGIVYKKGAELKNIAQKIMFSDIQSLDELDNEIIKITMEKHILFSVTIELTYNCNLKCPHCYVAKQDRKELDSGAYKTIIDDLERMQVVNIIFTGGEVFVRKDVLDIIEYACQKGFMVDIFTNGTLVSNEAMNRLLSMNLHSIQCSLYASDSKRHDDFVGVPGSFEKTLSVLKKAEENGILTAVKYCIMSCNSQEYNAMKELANMLHAELQITYSIMPQKDGNMKPTELRVKDDTNAKEVMKMLISDSKVKRREVDLNSPLCSAGYSSLSIDPYGDVYMCNALGVKLGTLADGIDNIWKNSEILEKWVHTTKSALTDCKDCGKILFCDFCPGTALKETGSPYKKYSDACQWASIAKEFLQS